MAELCSGYYSSVLELRHVVTFSSSFTLTSHPDPCALGPPRIRLRSTALTLTPGAFRKFKVGTHELPHIYSAAWLSGVGVIGDCF